MQNEMRDRLAELIKQAKQNTKNANCDLERNMLFADYLIEHGVIVQPCKVGDTVYYIPPDKSQVRVMLANQIFIDAGEKTIGDGDGIYFLFENFGKTVFLTKEEAEKALKEGVYSADL